MRIATRWIPRKPSILLIILAITAITQTTTCSAESQNTTLTEISNYHFDKGYYNLIKYAENSTSNNWIQSDTEIPYLNISYNALTNGFLQVTLIPTEGAVPYIELNTGWDTDGLNYKNSMHSGENAYFIIRPPMVFTDTNMSWIQGGAIMFWELYTWNNVSGQITYTFTPSEDIVLQPVVHPAKPREGDEVNLFTLCDATINNITWKITGEGINWVNNSEILTVNNLLAGDYTIQVEGYDVFNGHHQSQTALKVEPPVIEPTAFDVQFFSVNYPSSVTTGERVSVSATIDYSTPNITTIKCILYDSAGTECHQTTYQLSDSGSEQFSYNYIADQSGLNLYNLRLFYAVDGEWLELSESNTQLAIQVAEIKATPSIPGFSYYSIIAAITIASFLVKTQKNN